jgi:hypothetical protein
MALPRSGGLPRNPYGNPEIAVTCPDCSRTFTRWRLMCAMVEGGGAAETPARPRCRSTPPPPRGKRLSQAGRAVQDCMFVAATSVADAATSAIQSRARSQVRAQHS